MKPNKTERKSQEASIKTKEAILKLDRIYNVLQYIFDSKFHLKWTMKLTNPEGPLKNK